MNDVFILFDTSADSFVVDVQEKDAFRMWQGLAGPYYTPSVDAAGTLSWTNNGDLPNPTPINIQGRGLNVIGIVASVGDLPETATENDVYMVGASAPYEGYIYTGGTWVDIGEIGPGLPAGFGTPTATVGTGSGTPTVTVTASGPDTAKVFSFAFNGLKGTSTAISEFAPNMSNVTWSYNSTLKIWTGTYSYQPHIGALDTAQILPESFPVLELYDYGAQEEWVYFYPDITEIEIDAGLSRVNSNVTLTLTFKFKTEYGTNNPTDNGLRLKGFVMFGGTP